MADFAEDAERIAEENPAPDGATQESVAALADAAGSIRAATADAVDDITAAIADLVREKPLMSVALVAAAAYLFGRLR
jgi:ElaB/YqjD/DUF883 family membrane-anchored ribosome-binding protein